MSRCFPLSLLVAALFTLPLTAAEPEAKPAAEKPALPDYSAWKALTPEPIRVDRSIFTRCDRPAGGGPRAQSGRGPHFMPAVKIFANPAATEAINAGPKTPLPVGATIVKEKYWNEKDPKPSAYTAMIKREPGFDAEHGDWEYLHVELGEKPVVTRGVIKSCVQCHSIAKEKDYLFRTYLAVPAKTK
jgi:hypothetical protein